jgi:hypothetical protein
MHYLEQERQKLLKKCDEALKENLQEALDSIQELELIDKIYDGPTLRPDNIEFINSVLSDAIDIAKQIIEDNKRLHEAKFMLIVRKQIPPYASGEAGSLSSF